MNNLRFVLVVLSILIAFPALADDPPTVRVDGAGGRVEIKGAKVSGNATVEFTEGTLTGKEALVVKGNATARLVDVAILGKQIKKGNGRISISE